MKSFKPISDRHFLCRTVRQAKKNGWRELRLVWMRTGKIPRRYLEKR